MITIYLAAVYLTIGLMCSLVFEEDTAYRGEHSKVIAKGILWTAFWPIGLLWMWLRGE